MTVDEALEALLNRRERVSHREDALALIAAVRAEERERYADVMAAARGVGLYLLLDDSEAAKTLRAALERVP